MRRTRCSALILLAIVGAASSGCYEKVVSTSGLGSAGRTTSSSGEGNNYRTLGPKESDPRPNRPRQDGW